MKVKTFTGTLRFAVDNQVNDWLAKSNVTVHKTNVAFEARDQMGCDLPKLTCDSLWAAHPTAVWYGSRQSPLEEANAVTYL